ncbi:MAG TPA: thioesterase family protein [Terriglobia bacterium]|nr:thioesterase family protein [Terriglobia bacterium]
MPHTSETRFRARYSETDKMGVVYYANYLVWMEMGRTDYCKSVGFDYRDMERDGANMAVAEATCRYVSPARYDDEILVSTRVERLNRRLITFVYVITNTQTNSVLAEGHTVHIAMDKDGKARSIPDRYLELMKRVNFPD